MDQNYRKWFLGCFSVLAVVVLVVLAYGVLRLVTSGAPTVETIKASEFYSTIKNRPEEISSLEIDKDWITGTYSIGRGGFENFRVPRELNSEFPLVETLIANNIEFSYPEPSRFPEWLGFFVGGLLPLLLLLLPLLLLLLLIVFMYKRGRKRTEEMAGASIPEQIEQLSKLKDQGILSEEEFEEKKKELLSKM